MKAFKRKAVLIAFVGLGIGFYFWLKRPQPSQELIAEHERLMHLAQVYDRFTAYEALKASGDRLAAQAEAERLRHWKKNFPWKPTTDPAVEFDPRRHLQTGHLPGERNGFVDNAVSNNHITLKRFFQNEARFSAQFEQTHQILDEHVWANNPVGIGWVFNDLWKYQHAVKNDPDEPVLNPKMVTTITFEDKMNGVRPPPEIVGWEVERDPESGAVVTWGKKANSHKESMLGSLTAPEWLSPLPFEEEKAQAEFIRDQLIAEVEGMNDIPYPNFDGLSPEEEATERSYLSLMREGNSEVAEEMLVPYVGWTEAYQQYEDEFFIRLNQSIREGDPSLKAIRPDLFPPSGVVNNRLVDQHGDPIQAHDGFTGALITESGVTFPLSVGDDGSVLIPPPAEIESMRSDGEMNPSGN